MMDPQSLIGCSFIASYGRQVLAYLTAVLAAWLADYVEYVKLFNIKNKS